MLTHSQTAHGYASTARGTLLQAGPIERKDAMNDTEKAGTGSERWWEQAYSDMIYWKFNGETPAWAISSMVGFIEKTLGLTPVKVLDVRICAGRLTFSPSWAR